MEFLEEKDLKNLPKAKPNLICPNCGKFSYEVYRVLGITKPEFNSGVYNNTDPCMAWKEKYQCPQCETIYVINNGT